MDGIYEVTDAQGKKHSILRSLLRLHKRHSVASGHVTDDRIHNRHAMQHFTDHELKFLESYMNENYPDDIPKGCITRLHQHSDNASHFKSTGAIAYFTTLVDDRGGPSETAFVYSFGAPGHGKGPFDGIGGRWKNKIEQAMSTAMTKKLEFTDTGYIHGVEDVYKTLVYHFARATKKDSQLAGKNPIHHYKFFCYLTKENPIKRPTETFTTLSGITKRYQMCVKKKDVIHWRMRSCWCLSCVSSLYNGTLEWGEDHKVEHCNAVNEISVPEETDDGIHSDGNMFSFEKKACTKISGPGVAIQAQVITRDRTTMASELTVGDFVVFDTSDDDVEPIWIGRIMSNPEWQGQGVYKNVSRRITSFRGVQVARGEVALYIMWYEKINVMSDALEYWVSRTETEPILQNGRYLIPIEVTLHQMLGQPNVVPKLRTSTRGDIEQSEINNQRRIKDWHNRELEIIWNMDSETRRIALSSCDL